MFPPRELPSVSGNVSAWAAWPMQEVGRIFHAPITLPHGREALDGRAGPQIGGVSPHPPAGAYGSDQARGACKSRVAPSMLSR
jgi:hypothetical protein